MNSSCYEAFATNEVPYCLRAELPTLWAWPYSHLLHVRGTNEKITISFSSHDLVIEGKGLGVVFEGVAQHRICLLRTGSDETEVHIEKLQIIDAELLGTNEESAAL